MAGRRSLHENADAADLNLERAIPVSGSESDAEFGGIPILAFGELEEEAGDVEGIGKPVGGVNSGFDAGFDEAKGG